MAGKPQFSPEKRAQIVSLLTGGMQSYGDIAKITGVSRASVGRIALQDKLRPSEHTQKFKGAMVAAEVNRARTAVSRANESMRMVGNISNLNDMWDERVASPEEVILKELSELARTMSMLARAHTDLERAESLSKLNEGGSGAASMVSDLMTGLERYVADQ